MSGLILNDVKVHSEEISTTGRRRGRPSGTVASRPELARLGLHRLSAAIVFLHLLLGAANVIGFRATGLSYEWTGLALIAPVAGMLVIAWVAHAWAPGRPHEWVRAEALFALLLVSMGSALFAPLQYVGVALGRPLVDAQLAAADADLGVYVPSMVLWCRTHPWITPLLNGAYGTLLLQMAAPAIIAGAWYGDREAVWEFTFNYHVCALVTVACLAAWPAAGAFTFYGFESLIDQSRFLHQFSGFRSGALTTVNPSNLEGLVSFPSLHVAGALSVTWALRARRAVLAVLVVVNAALIGSVVGTGAHYFVDVIAGVVVFAISAALWRILRIPQRWLRPTRSEVCRP